MVEVTKTVGTAAVALMGKSDALQKPQSTPRYFGWSQ